MQINKPHRASKRALGLNRVLTVGAVAVATAGLWGCSGVQTAERPATAASGDALVEGTMTDPAARARARVQPVLDGRAEQREIASAEAARLQVGYDVLPSAIRAKVDGKIAKKLRAGATTGGADAIAFFMEQRLPEGEEYPINRVREIARAEYEKADLIAFRRAQRGLAREDGASSGGFDLRGSDPVIDGWQPLGPGNVGGRTRAMVISPFGPGTGEEGDPGFMLAAGVAGGVFKSTDDGASWRPTTDLLANIAVCTLALDPMDPNIVYAGTGEGFSNGGAVRGLGVFKSEDAGETWRQLAGTTPPLVTPIAFHYVNKVAVSPSDSLRIYAATRSGVWIHRNGGDPENADGDEFQWELVLANPFFTLGQQISRGSSVGATDLQIQPAPVNGESGDVEDEVVLAAFGGFVSDGLYISANGGESWFRVIDESASEDELYRIDTEAQGRMTISFSSRVNGTDAGVVYVLMARNQDRFSPDIPKAGLEIPFGAVLSVFRADLAALDIERDGNDEITSVTLPFESRLNLIEGANPLNTLLLSNALFSGVCGSSVSPGLNQGWYDNIIKVDPVNRNVVWAGGIDLFRSDDGGRNFGLASYWYFDQDEDEFVHADQHEIVFHPDYDGSLNATMYFTNDGGIYRTLDALAPVADDGCPFPDGKKGKATESEVVFESLNNGYEVTQFYHGDTGSSVSGGRDLYVGGTQDNGTVRTLQRRCTEDWTELLGGDGGYVAVNPEDNNLIYAETQNFGNIFRIKNTPGFGEGATSISNNLRGRDSGLFITPFAMDPNDPATIWTGGSRPWRTTNADSAVTELILWRQGPNLNLEGIPPLFDIVGRISAIAVAPTDPKIVYVGTEDGWIARTGNGTSNSPDWVVLSNGLPIETGFVSSIAVDPDDPNVIWFTNSRFTNFDPNDPSPDSNLYRGECDGDCQNAESWTFVSMDGFDCDTDDEINPVLPDVPAHWVSIRRCDGGGCGTGKCLVFVGTEIGVYVSDDAYTIDNNCDPIGDGSQLFDSVTWTLINIGEDPSIGVMPTTVVESIDFRDDNTIVAFTYGRGAFLANILRECGSIIEGEPCSAADLAAPFGVVGGEDLNAWVQDTATGRLSADMPAIGEDCGDGVLDLFDINRFIELFQDGCP